MKNRAKVFHLLFALAVSMLGQGTAVADIVTYYHTDLSGSPVAGSDVNGNIVWRESYTPYGERRLEQVSSGSNRRWFTGQPHEEFSGLTYLGARHYDPMIGRFMGVDPVGPSPSDQFGFNRYAYADNDPYGKTDPNGEFAQVIYGAIAGAVGGYVSSGGSFSQKALGVVVGGLAGAIVGSVLPQASSFAGAAAAGAISSALGQVLGSASTAIATKGLDGANLSDIKVSPITTAAAALGAGVGSAVSAGIANSTSQAIIGNTVAAAGAPTATGVAVGAVVEGAITGGAEKIAPQIGNAATTAIQKAGTVLNQVKEKL
jgi:RHS repeat-associated protein